MHFEIFKPKHQDILENYFSIFPEKTCNHERDSAYAITALDCITLDFIEKHPDWEWNYSLLSMNNNITEDFVEKHINWDWDVNVLSAHPNITLKFIERHLDWEWRGFNLSRNPNITEKFIEDNPNLDWSYIYLSSNPAITMNFVQKHFNGIQGSNITDNYKKWDEERLALNPNLTIEFIENSLNLGLNWNSYSSTTMSLLSQHPNITLKFIEKYPYWKWNIISLLKNPNMTISFVRKNSHWWKGSETSDLILGFLSRKSEKNKIKIAFLMNMKEDNSTKRFMENNIFDRNLLNLIFIFL